MSYYTFGTHRQLRGLGAAAGCVDVPYTAYNGQTGTQPLCVDDAGACGSYLALQQALTDLGFQVPVNGNWDQATMDALQRAMGAIGSSYQAGSYPKAANCQALQSAWLMTSKQFTGKAPGAATTRNTSQPSQGQRTSTSALSPIAIAKLACVGNCVRWDAVEQKCFAVSNCTPKTQGSSTGGGGSTPARVTQTLPGTVPGTAACPAGTYGVPPNCTPALIDPQKLYCESQQGAWDPTTGTCLIAGRTDQQPPTEQPPTAAPGFWASLADWEKYAIVGGGVLAVGAVGAGIYFASKKPKATPNRRRRSR